MLASKRTGKERDLYCPLLVRRLISLLEVLLISLLEILLDSCILLNVTKTLITSAYHILVGLESTICIRFLIITILILQEIELFQL